MSRVSKARQRIYSALRIKNTLVKQALGEFFGTFLLVFVGDGVIAQVVLGMSDHRYAHGSFDSISLTWGLAIMLGVFIAGQSGKGLINPALNVAFGMLGHIGVIQAVVFTVAQILGAFLGAASLYTVYIEHIRSFANLTAAGALTINNTGFIFCTIPTVSNLAAFWDQVVGTSLLALGILAITDKNNFNVPSWAHPMTVGLLFVSIVGSFCLNAGAALNPARDFGPRAFIAIAGWGKEAFTHDDYFFWVPIVGPLLGAILGSVLYQLLIGIHLMSDEEVAKEEVHEETHMLEEQN